MYSTTSANNNTYSMDIRIIACSQCDKLEQVEHKDIPYQYDGRSFCSKDCMQSFMDQEKTKFVVEV